MLKFLIGVVPVCILGSSMANAGQNINVAGVMTCVIDKWNESEPEKGHKLVDYAGRCVIVPDDAGVQKAVEDCSGTYEYMPDGSWKGSGGCTAAVKSGDTISLTWEEGSQLKESLYTYTGGTGKYKGAKGGGSYKVDELTTTLYGGRKKGNIELP